MRYMKEGVLRTILRILFSYFSMKTYVVTSHQNHLSERGLMMGHNICLKGLIWKLIPNLSLFSLPFWSTEPV